MQVKAPARASQSLPISICLSGWVGSFGSPGPRMISSAHPIVNRRTDAHALLGHQSVTVGYRGQLVCNQYPTCRLCEAFSKFASIIVTMLRYYAASRAC
jgi:hypothetical protein